MSASDEQKIFSLIRSNDVEGIKRWISDHEVNKNVTDSYCFTPLNDALWFGGEAALIFIKNNMHINVPTQRGNTPLHIAVHHPNNPAIGLLIERGADINFVNDDHKSPLNWAFYQVHEDYCNFKILLEFGASCICNSLSYLRFGVEKSKNIALHYLKLQKFTIYRKMLNSRTMLKFYQTFQFSFKE